MSAYYSLWHWGTPSCKQRHFINGTHSKLYIWLNIYCENNKKLLMNAGRPSIWISSIKSLKIVNSNSLQNCLSQIRLFVDWLVLFRVLILLSQFVIILSFNYYTVLGYYSLSLFINLIYMFNMFICCLLCRNKSLYVKHCVIVRNDDKAVCKYQKQG